MVVWHYRLRACRHLLWLVAGIAGVFSLQFGVVSQGVGHPARRGRRLLLNGTGTRIGTDGATHNGNFEQHYARTVRSRAQWAPDWEEANTPDRPCFGRATRPERRLGT